MSFLIGLTLGAAAVALLALRGGSPAVLLDPKAAAFVLAGMLAALFVTFPFSALRAQLRTIFRLLRPAGKPRELIETIGGLAQTARRGGVLALEGSEKKIGDPMLKKGLLLIASSVDQSALRSILEKESELIARREKASQEFFERLAALTVGIGVAGSLLEAALLLTRYTGPQKLAGAAAQALLPAVYAALVAYLVLLPLAARVRLGAARQQELRELSIEGVLAIQAGEPSQVVEERLGAFLTGEKHAG